MKLLLIGECPSESIRHASTKATIAPVVARAEATVVMQHFAARIQSGPTRSRQSVTTPQEPHGPRPPCPTYPLQPNVSHNHRTQVRLAGLWILDRVSYCASNHKRPI